MQFTKLISLTLLASSPVFAGKALPVVEETAASVQVAENTAVNAGDAAAVKVAKKTAGDGVVESTTGAEATTTGAEEMENQADAKKIRNGNLVAGFSGAAAGGLVGGIIGNAYGRRHKVNPINVIAAAPDPASAPAAPAAPAPAPAI